MSHKASPFGAVAVICVRLVMRQIIQVFQNLESHDLAKARIFGTSALMRGYRFAIATLSCRDA